MVSLRVCPKGRKEELPPTKQEIPNPYVYKVTDILSGHYGYGPEKTKKSLNYGLFGLVADLEAGPEGLAS